MTLVHKIAFGELVQGLVENRQSAVGATNVACKNDHAGILSAVGGGDYIPAVATKGGRAYISGEKETNQVKHRTITACVLALFILGCKTGKGAEAAAKREADRQAMRLEDLENQRNTLRTRVQQLEQENAELKKQLAGQGK